MTMSGSVKHQTEDTDMMIYSNGSQARWIIGSITITPLTCEELRSTLDNSCSTGVTENHLSTLLFDSGTMAID